jgi:hypothetical protein
MKIIGFDIETLFSYGDNLFIDLEMECLSIRSAILKTNKIVKRTALYRFDPVIANSTHPM